MTPPASSSFTPPGNPAFSSAGAAHDDGQLGSDLKTREVELIVRALKEEPSRKDAAERLGISPRTLRYKMARLRDEGVDVESMVVAS